MRIFVMLVVGSIIGVSTYIAYYFNGLFTAALAGISMLFMNVTVSVLFVEGTFKEVFYAIFYSLGWGFVLIGMTILTGHASIGYISGFVYSLLMSILVYPYKNLEEATRV